MIIIHSLYVLTSKLGLQGAKEKEQVHCINSERVSIKNVQVLVQQKYKPIITDQGYRKELGNRKV